MCVLLSRYLRGYLAVEISTREGNIKCAYSPASCEIWILDLRMP